MAKRKRLVAEINVVPYIDVMLVLLVIFMITTPLLTQGVKVSLPQAHANVIEKKQQDPLIVTVDQKGNYYLNVNAKPNSPISTLVMANRVAAELRIAHESGQKLPVYVRADKNVNYGKVVTAMVILQQAGAANVGLMTETPPTA